jgi:uncharacterized protein (DUF433 family)
MINLMDAVMSGTGVYSIPEAARYARMHPATLRSWFSGGKDRRPLRPNEIDSQDFKGLTFLDFVEAIAIRSLRRDYGISFQRIRQAVNLAKSRYGIDHPFAMEHHRTFVVGKEIHITLPEDQVNPVQITGKDVGQKSFRPCLEGYMQDLTFDGNGVANLYRAFEYRNQEIILTPKIHFGEPVVKENGYTALTLYKAAVIEGSIERAATLYDASIESVEASYRYFNQELTEAA